MAGRQALKIAEHKGSDKDLMDNRMTETTKNGHEKPLTALHEIFFSESITEHPTTGSE